VKTLTKKEADLGVGKLAWDLVGGDLAKVGNEHLGQRSDVGILPQAQAEVNQPPAFPGASERIKYEVMLSAPEDRHGISAR
jgi:hypothetical protein